MPVKRFCATTALVIAAVGQSAVASGRAPARDSAQQLHRCAICRQQRCAFVRAGSGGAITWVPRMARDRKHICNAQPTGPVGASTTERIIAASTAGVVQLTVPSAGRTQTRVTPPRVAADDPSSCSKCGSGHGENARSWRSSHNIASGHTAPTYGNDAAKLTKHGDARAASDPVCAEPSCHHKLDRHRGARTGGWFGTSMWGDWNKRAVYQSRTEWPGAVWATGGPSHDKLPYRAAERGPQQGWTRLTGAAPLEAVNANPVAAGYRTAWNDGRLNQDRGSHGHAYHAQGDRVLLWTSHAPYRLIDIATGQDVTAHYPQYAPPDGAITA